MSGGSYDYLCYSDDLSSRRRTIKRMAERLEGLGWAPEAAEATRRVIDLLDQADAAADALREVWHDIEWWDSSDYGEGQVREEIDRYRASLPARPAVHRSYRVRLRPAPPARRLSALSPRCA